MTAVSEAWRGYLLMISRYHQQYHVKSLDSMQTARYLNNRIKTNQCLKHAVFYMFCSMFLIVIILLVKLHLKVIVSVINILRRIPNYYFEIC